MNLIFRKVDETNPEDIRQFNELMDDLTAHAEDVALLKEKIRKTNANENIFLMVAEDTDTSRLCGSILGIVHDDYCEACRPFMLIENVVTHHDYRHMGVGRQMFERIEEWGKEWNVSYVILCSGLNREGAHKFYQSIGYEEIKGFKKYLG